MYLYKVILKTKNIDVSNRLRIANELLLKPRVSCALPHKTSGTEPIIDKKYNVNVVF